MTDFESDLPYIPRMNRVCRSPHLLLTIICALVLLPTVVHAQQGSDTAGRSSIAVGGWAHYLLLNHRASFARLPGIPNCCREFTGGTGGGFELGGLLDVPLSDRFELEGRLGVVLQSVGMREEEGTTVIIDGEPTEGSFEHQLDASFVHLDLFPALLWKPFDDRFRIHIGPAVGFFLSQTFEQREVLVEPASVGVFENNRRIRNEQQGDIPEASGMFLAARAFVSWELPLNSSGTLWIAPEIGYSLGLGNIIPDSSWSTDWLAVGAAIRFGGRGRADVPVDTLIPPPPEDTLIVKIDTPQAPSFTASIEARGVEEDGTEREIAILRVEEFISTNMRPLLNYVFFEENRHTIPRRYIRLDPSEVADFDVDRLHSVPVIRTYHHILNIIGRRMREHPEGVVTLTGTNDGLGERLLDGTELSTRRARSVREYLMSVWEIDSTRLPLEFRDLPEKPSNVDVPDGVEENRRVELSSDTWAILEPVVTVDTLRLTNPPMIRIYPTTDLVRPVASWSVVVRQGGSPIRTFTSEESESGALPTSITWNLAADQHNVPRTDHPVTFELTVVDRTGTSVTSVLDTLPVEQITVTQKRRERIKDRYIDRYSLILFDFDRAELNQANDTIARFIRERLTPEASVEIIGQTDRIGEEEYNLRLSRRRADSTAEALGLPPEVAEGEGENVDVYDNDLPEGRFYSRTVRILVETPIAGDKPE